MTDHYETRCPMCGGSDEQGCYADCPSLRKGNTMTDWADEIARNAVEKWTPHWEFEVEYRVAAALRSARKAALEEAWQAWKNAGEDAEVGNAIRALKTTETGNKTS